MNRKYFRVAAAGLCIAGLTLAGCGSDEGSSGSSTTEAKVTTSKPAALSLTDVWARKSPAGSSVGAVYLTITSPIDDQLVDVSVPASVAKTAELHETTAAAEPGSMGTTTTAMGGADGMTTTTAAMGGGDMTTTSGDMGSGGDMGDGGSMTMRPVDAIDLPAGKAVMLEPGGYHVMLLDLASPLKVGDKIEVTLTFDKAGTKTVEAEVREA